MIYYSTVLVKMRIYSFYDYCVFRVDLHFAFYFIYNLFLFRVDIYLDVPTASPAVHGRGMYNCNPIIRTRLYR